MAIKMRYIGLGARIVYRTDFTAAGLIDPGADMIFSTSLNNKEIDVSNAHAAFLLAQGDFLQPDGLKFADLMFARAPVKVVSTTGYACGVVAGTWHDLDTAGSAAAKPFDVVIPNVQAGQWICITPGLSSNSSSAAFVGLDCWSIVGGVAINKMGPATVSVNGGVPAWKLITSTLSIVCAPTWYQVQAGDIESGSIRMRLRDFNSGTTARSLVAGSGYDLTLTGTGPFG